MMTKKDFFIILIKLFGLYTFIVALFDVVPGMLSIFQFGFGFDLYSITYVFASFAFFVFLLFYLLFHSDKIVLFLKLDKGFDTDEIHIEKLDKGQVIQLGLIIVGGILFLEHLPALLTNCFYLFKSMSQKSMGYEATEFMTTENYTTITKDFITVIVGYLVLTNHEAIEKKYFN